MTEANKKTIIKLVVAALAALLVLLIVALIVNLVRLSAVNDRMDSLAAQSEYLEKAIDENGKLLDYCQTSSFIENYAREYLDMIYRGEIVLGTN